MLSLALGATLFGAIVILPQYTQGILGFTATLSGELIFARAIFIAIFTPFVARLAGTGRVDTRILLFIGFSMIGVAQFWLAAVTTTQSDFGALLLPAAFQSLSLQLGGSLSTAALITLLARRNAFHQDMLAASATAANPALAALLKYPHAIALEYAQIQQQASALSYADAQFALGVLTFTLMPLIFVMPGRRKDVAHVEVTIE